MLIQGPAEKATSHETMSALSLGYLQLVSLETDPGSQHVRPGLELGGLQGRQPGRSFLQVHLYTDEVSQALSEPRDI